MDNQQACSNIHNTCFLKRKSRTWYHKQRTNTNIKEQGETVSPLALFYNITLSFFILHAFFQ
ncbi:hypothetical protein P4S91_04840, partial [Aneurinibacillus aneurinilyticus]|nr:hypothetical protein [Aneurinibacillus aneurinilyticus]MED0722259.1 hypothetical protein [Aneurinibacillus aneurinilyticus]